MNIVFCHGVLDLDEDWNTRQYNPNKRWEDWLQFMVEFDHDVIMQMPKFPHAHELLMKYDEWEKIMDKQDINHDTVLIGHSAGGGFILKYMALHPELHVRQIVLVAPWLDAENAQPFGFYKDFELNNSILAQTEKGIDLMISDDDDPLIINSCNKITKNISGIRVHKFSGYGHFIRPELPEIISIIQF